MSEEEKQAFDILDSFEPDDLIECAIYRNALEKINNLIEKQQKEIKNSISKDKIREKMQEYYEKASPYDCDTADYKQSQEIGGWNALRKLLEE